MGKNNMKTGEVNYAAVNHSDSKPDLLQGVPAWDYTEGLWGRDWHSSEYMHPQCDGKTRH
jgi:hypothetical protein